MEYNRVIGDPGGIFGCYVAGRVGDAICLRVPGKMMPSGFQFDPSGQAGYVEFYMRPQDKISGTNQLLNIGGSKRVVFSVHVDQITENSTEYVITERVSTDLTKEEWDILVSTYPNKVMADLLRDMWKDVVRERGKLAIMGAFKDI